MDLEHFAPPKDDERVLSFCEIICPGEKPCHVAVIPDKDSVMLRCFQNVAAKVARDGGSLILGWDISWMPKIYLEAQFHAVWESPSGGFFDVTPPAVPPQLAPPQSRILFLIDRRRTYNGQIVPPHRLALGDKTLVERYLVLSDCTSEVLASLQLAGFPPGHPVYRSRLADVRAERLSIEERLQK